MKIVYISLIYSKSGMDGVKKRIAQEAKYFKNYEIDVTFLNREKDGYEDNIEYKKVDNYYSMPKILFELYLRTFTFDVIEKVVDLNRYDKIYLRYPLMDFSALRFAKKHKSKIITQHHGKELEEILRYKINPLFKFMQYFLERYLAPIFFKNISSITAISDDLLLYEKKRVNFKGKLIRFSNGIDYQKYPMHNTPELKDSFSFIIVASSFTPWHGLDRILKSLAIYNGDIIIKLHIVGNIPDNYTNLISKAKKNSKVEIISYGNLYGKELDYIFDKAHMACDSLAMYRLNMSESSTLKSKEYIARAIPFIYSASDRDLEQIKEYLYDVGNSDSLINFDKILNFYKNLDIINIKSIMRDIAKKHLSWEEKIKKLKESISC